MEAVEGVHKIAVRSNWHVRAWQRAHSTSLTRTVGVDPRIDRARHPVQGAAELDQDD